MNPISTLEYSEKASMCEGRNILAFTVKKIVRSVPYDCLSKNQKRKEMPTKVKDYLSNYEYKYPLTKTLPLLEDDSTDTVTCVRSYYSLHYLL